MKLAMKPVKQPRKPSLAKPKSARPVTAKRVLTGRAPAPATRSSRSPQRATRSQWTSGIASGASGLRRYRLFKPAGMGRGQRLPQVVMLHGCAQDAQRLAASTRIGTTRVLACATGAGLVATLCLIQGLGHAWGGGAPGLAYSDPQGPDASRMAWSFMQKQFATQAAGSA